MPNPGDQHRVNNASTANPFEEQKRHISAYTAREIATLQSRLSKRLGPEYISTRPGPGNQKIAYLSAEKAINLANEVFGFNGWSSSIQQIDVDFVEENPHTGKVSLGLSVIVRVTLKDGTYHEDIGYGGIENCKGKAMAFEKSKKEATTDALKRSLRNFGNVLGNCIYDRNFVTEVSKVKPGPGAKFDINDLHRHADYAPKLAPGVGDRHITPRPAAAVDGTRSISHTEFDDSFDMGEFDDVDFDEGDLERPDEILLPVEPESAAHRNTRPEKQGNNTPSRPPQRYAAASLAAPSPATTGRNSMAQVSADTILPRHAQATHSDLQETSVTTASSLNFGPQQATPGQEAISRQGSSHITAGAIGPSGFYSAKAAQNIDQNNSSNLPSNAARFNPHAESPSIRKTAGIDHNRSVPVKRDLLRSEGNGPPKEFVDPKTDTNRRIGMPAQAGSLAGRTGLSASAYRPPTRYGSPTSHGHGQGQAHGVATSNIDRPLNPVKRPPLADVSNAQHTATAITVDGLDAKRQKTSGLAVMGENHVVNGEENVRV